ncbi:porin family protein [Hyphobacterium sp. HN65]|uniref:Porin family protein n=1 Tax=Hyphobacterium lacteum TaxID=3116575 RepID=A0ABU7LNJ7_9PROT|nr:porin family protein [Hyphobacterium sp. HN65]MEE2525501.1 porin family protein [Hyphobacterium sp. HN65]
MMRTLVLSTVLAAAASAASFADDGDFTLGAGLSTIGVSEGGFDVDVSAVTLRGGYEFTRFLGFEGQLDIGVDGDTVMFNNTPVDVDVNMAASLFGVARAPISENANLFARIGYTTANIEASVPGFGLTDDADGFAYGVGGEFFFDGRNGVRIDYTRHELDDADADVFGISYVRRFGATR